MSKEGVYMKDTHIFNYSKEEVFSVIEESVKAEVSGQVKSEIDDLSGVVYQNKVGRILFKYIILNCNIEEGYSLKIEEEDQKTYFLLNITLKELSENQTELTYDNTFHSEKYIKNLNYKITKFIFKKRIRMRFESFINFIENSLEVKNEENTTSM